MTDAIANHGLKLSSTPPTKNKNIYPPQYVEILFSPQKRKALCLKKGAVVFLAFGASYKMLQYVCFYPMAAYCTPIIFGLCAAKVRQEVEEFCVPSEDHRPPLRSAADPSE
eukprot:Trichotokara_eunicae@DN6143_c0_g1_i2.p1